VRSLFTPLLVLSATLVSQPSYAIEPYEFCEKFPKICEDSLIDQDLLMALIDSFDHQMSFSGVFDNFFEIYDGYPEELHTTIARLLPAIATRGGQYADELAYEVSRLLVEGIEGIGIHDPGPIKNAQLHHYIRGIQEFTTADWILFMDLMIPPQTGDRSGLPYRATRLLWEQSAATTADMHRAFLKIREMKTAFLQFPKFLLSLHKPDLIRLSRSLGSFDATNLSDPWTTQYVSYLGRSRHTQKPKNWTVHQLYQDGYKPRDTKVSQRSSEIYLGQDRDLGKEVRVRFIPNFGPPITLQGRMTDVEYFTLTVNSDGETYIFNHHGVADHESAIEGRIDFLMVHAPETNYSFFDFIEDLLMSYSGASRKRDVCPFLLGE
jgi:hypothetical protein